MAETDVIGDNLPCHACGYILRGLKFDGLCPECGEPIRDSFQSATAELAKLLNEDPLNIAHRLRFQKIADDVNCSIDALLFVQDSIDQARRTQKSEAMTAASICFAVQSRVKKYFNDDTEAHELLEEWGIRTGEDIGKIALGLARHGLLQLSKDETVEKFTGLFSLEG